ncbi:MAG: transcription antitermination factor NusB [Candidatus Omnitrophica bacterium]|nr:transcription antitermination factor NusB [Candidatus Omnitrophota bacterium]
MRKRTRAREIALQILYQIDVTRDNPESTIENFWQGYTESVLENDLKDFSEELVRGVSHNISLIDEKITLYAANWQLDRMAVVDRNILRLGCYELLFRDDIPPKVSINEAVEIAKKYSDVEAGKFVNAILDKVRIEKKP